MLSLLSTHMPSPIFLALDDNVIFSYTSKQMKYGMGYLLITFSLAICMFGVQIHIFVPHATKLRSCMFLTDPSVRQSVSPVFW